MNTNKSVPLLSNLLTRINWKLLLFLVLFLNVKLLVKIGAIIIIYLLQNDFRFGFKLRNSRLPLFYLYIITIAFIDWVIYKGFTDLNYSIVFITGVTYWILCILAVHQIKLFVEKTSAFTIHNTIIAFFIINAIASVLTFIPILWEIRELNPYLYQGEYQKYFISTGDYIRGITFDVSTTNAILNAFGVVYFLIRDNFPMLLLCMVILLFTGSNFVNLILLLTFAYLFIFKTGRDQKSMIFICLLLLSVFMAKISPQNNDYVNATVKNIFSKESTAIQPSIISSNLNTEKSVSELTPEERKVKIAKSYLDSLNAIFQKKYFNPNLNYFNNRGTKFTVAISKPVIPGDSIHTSTFQSRKDTTYNQRELIFFAKKHEEDVTVHQKEKAVIRLPGKIIALKQTTHFFLTNPLKIITGTGPGNFSSKLAFRATGLKIAGGYPGKFIYINQPFLDNHLGLYLYFFSKNVKYHSLTNSPASVYDQLLCEYGIVGMLAFIICYWGFFLQHWRKLTYGIPILILLLCSFAVEYWFEQLSIVIFFELFLLLNIKEGYDKRENKNNIE